MCDPEQRVGDGPHTVSGVNTLRDFEESDPGMKRLTIRGRIIPSFALVLAADPAVMTSRTTRRSPARRVSRFRAAGGVSG